MGRTNPYISFIHNADCSNTPEINSNTGMGHRSGSGGFDRWGEQAQSIIRAKKNHFLFFGCLLEAVQSQQLEVRLYNYYLERIKKIS